MLFFFLFFFWGGGGIVLCFLFSFLFLGWRGNCSLLSLSEEPTHVPINIYVQDGYIKSRPLWAHTSVLTIQLVQVKSPKFLTNIGPKTKMWAWYGRLQDRRKAYEFLRLKPKLIWTSWVGFTKGSLECSWSLIRQKIPSNKCYFYFSQSIEVFEALYLIKSNKFYTCHSSNFIPISLEYKSQDHWSTKL